MHAWDWGKGSLYDLLASFKILLSFATKQALFGKENT